MSFGFSVGDILLASKLAYKLYSTIATGKRSAVKDLQELGDVLFGLRCALDHLGKAAEDIRATTSNDQDANAVEIRHKLDTMVYSCNATLQELGSVTEPYREAMKSDESQDRKPSMARLRDNVHVNWMKIRWAMERSSLSEYRARLQSHMDAINMVLTTFLWSATHRNELNMQELHQKIRTLLLTLNPSPHHPGTVQADSKPADGAVNSESRHYRYVAPIAMVQPRSPTGVVSASTRPRATQWKIPSTIDVPASYPNLNPKSQRKLPAAIVNLNLRRQSTGSQVFKEYHKKWFESTPPYKPPFLSHETPTLPQLCDGLSYIFRPFPPTTAHQATLSRGERKEEVIRWAQGLDHFLRSCTSEAASSPPDSKEAKQADQNAMVDLLVGLNGLIEKSDDNTKRLFYQGADQAGFNEVLDRLQTVWRSVRAMKEVEEFHDVRDEGTDNQHGG